MTLPRPPRKSVLGCHAPPAKPVVFRISYWSCCARLVTVWGDLRARAGPDKSERRWRQREAEQAPPERRYVVVVLLGRGRRDHFNLRIGEPEFAVEFRRLWITRLGVGQIKLGRAGLQNHVADWAVGNIRQALRGQHHRRVLLAAGAQPPLPPGPAPP